MYEGLYCLAREPACCEADCWEEGLWVVDLKRSLSIQEYNMWLGLLEILNDIALTNNKADFVLWVLDKKQQFTTKSLYLFLTDRGVSSRVASYIWKSKLPLKIKFFLWQVFNNKLQVAQNLVKKGWKGNINYCVCGCLESIDHIFFKCHLAKYIWSFIKEVCQLNSYPTSLDDFNSTWLMGKGPFPIWLIIFLFVGFVWALWTSRNKMTINKKFPKYPIDVIFIALSLMQK